jgi:hypothetical protein
LIHTFYNCYDNNQYGFRPASSTACAFISLHNHILQCIETKKNHSIFILSFDIKKAFDTINHDLLIEILLNYNLPTGLVTLINSYLNCRQQTVSHGRTVSDPALVVSGVPQGSIWGPMLFNIYISTLGPTNNSIKSIKYADDTTFVLALPPGTDYVDAITQEIKHVTDWCSKFGMTLNQTKTKILPITCSSKLQPSNTTNNIQNLLTKDLKFLGFILQNNLQWTSHLNQLIKKISTRLHIIRSLKFSLPPSQLLLIYKGIIQSLIDYCLPIQFNLSKKEINRIILIQKRAHRIICGPDCVLDCIPNFYERRMTLSSNFLNRILTIDNHIIKDIVPLKSQRSGRLILPSVTTNKYLNSFLIQCSINYNNNI